MGFSRIKLPDKYTPVLKKRVSAKIMTDTESLEAQLLERHQKFVEQDEKLAEKDEMIKELLQELGKRSSRSQVQCVAFCYCIAGTFHKLRV